MNRLITTAVIALAAGFLSINMAAQTDSSRKDSIATAIRLNGLHSKKAKLEKEIKAEDGKRNSQIAGVTAETLEEMNNRQDSICLALRSELVEVILEIKELSPGVASPQLLQHYNNLVNRKEEKPQSSPAKKAEN